MASVPFLGRRFQLQLNGMPDKGRLGFSTKNAAWSRIIPDKPGSNPRIATRAIAMVPQ